MFFLYYQHAISLIMLIQKVWVIFEEGIFD